MKKRLLFVIAESSYFISHRFYLAQEAKKAGYEVAIATSSSKDFLKDKLIIESEGIQVFHTPFERTSINPFKDLKTISSLFKIFKKWNPAVVHNVALKPILYSSILLKLLRPKAKIVNAVAGLGFVFTSHSLKARLLKKPVQYFLKKALSNSTIIVQNQDDLRLFKQWMKEKSNISLIHGAGVDLTLFTPTDSFPNNPTITFVARMLKSKGVFELIKAIKIVKKQIPALEVHFVGEPDYLNPEHIAEKFLKEWHNEGLIVYHGHQSEINAFYQKSTMAVLPSYREGLPKSLIEAAACGLPLITTDVPGCRDMIKKGNGILVPPKDSQALATAILKILEDKTNYKKMGKNSRQLAEEVFCQKAIAKQTIQLYD